MRSTIDVFAEIYLSDRLYDLVGPKRVWNRIEKDALSEELEKHHRERIPDRFRQDARTTYHHQPRDPGYKAKKRRVYHSTTDLVKTGITENRITREHQITIEGSATGSKFRDAGLIGHLKMKFPFPGSSDNKPGKVQMDQLKREIIATTDQEEQDISFGWGSRVTRAITSYKGGSRRAYKSA